MSRSTGVAVLPPGPAPLSPVQRSLWILAQLAGGEPVNVRPVHLRLRGPLDVAGLATALSRLVERHSILRSTFPMVGGDPVQVVGDTPAFDLEPIDLTSEVDPEAVARDLTDRHARTAFDLTTEAPFRPSLIRLATDDHVLTIAMHHIVFDGWSERRLHDEVAVIYDAVVDGASPQLDPLPIQFRDAAAWLSSRADEAGEAADLDWWEKRLADLPPDLELPVDRPPLDAEPPSPLEVDLGQELTAALGELAARHQATVFMVLMAAVQTLTMRLTGQHDVIVGFPSAGRPRPETEPLIGCFIDSIAVRSQLDPDAGFAERLAGTRQDVLEALSHTAVPFSRVMGAIRPWTGGDRTPLYRVQVQLRNFPGEVRNSRHLEIEPFGVLPGAGAHLSVRAELRDGSLHLSVLHDPSRFRAETVRRWTGALQRVLEAAVADESTPIGDIEVMGSEERTLVAGGWDGTPDETLVPTLAADRLRSIAQSQPGAIAVLDGARQVTYAEFDRMVDRTASALEARGIGAEDAVVLFLDRSIEAAVAVFAALRAGVAYVPVDTELTAEWLSSVVEQVSPAAVVVDPHHGDQLTHLGVPLVTVDELVAESSGSATRTPAPDDLAYILYTSGSTGVPKGVMVEQGNLATFLAADDEAERSHPGDRVLWFHSMSFDAVAKGLHSPLVTGATMVVRDEEAIRSIPRFLAWCDRVELTHLPIPTSFAHVLFEEAVAVSAELPDRLSVVSFGGEQARADLAEAWLAHYGDRVRLRNTYGPTETTIWLTAVDLETADVPFGRVSIGRPYRGAKIRVVDDRGNLVPIGVNGELLLGGSLVSRGYLGAPDLTAERFTTDGDGVRWYRSGDLGRWLPDGSLEVLGRLDRQVKIRGYRVEPGEVEAALRSLAAVRDAAAVVAPGLDGELALHAYAESNADPADLAARLAVDLPAFLRPSTVTVLDEFPRSISGKLDARRLPEPGTRAVRATPTDVAQADGALDAVRSIWMDVLGVDEVNPEDGFFALGGHSLLAIRVISRIRDSLGIDVPLPTLFTHPTLGELVGEVSSLLGADPARPETGAGATGEQTESEPDLAALLDEIERLSDEEAAALLATLEADGGS